MENQRTVFVVFAGSFEDSALTSRLKIFGNSLRNVNYKVIYVSQFPGRNLREFVQDNLIYLSFYPSNRNSLLARFSKVLVGHFRLIVYLFSNVKNTDIVFYYNPNSRSSLLSMFLLEIVNRVTIILDKTELFQHEKNTWYNRLGDKWAFKYATIPFAISDKLMDFGKRHTDKQIMKLPIAVDFERFDYNLVPRNKLIGYVGTAASKDGLDIVLKGFFSAVEQESDLRLKLIGPKPIFFDFEGLVAQLGISDRIELTGSISFEQIPQLLLECDTFIMNRDASLFAQYGYPTKLGEYFACNRPVLMSDGPGFSEDYKDRVEAIKYKFNDPQALADAIIWRYENSAEAAAIAQRGYNYAKTHFSSEVVGKMFMDTLKERGILP